MAEPVGAGLSEFSAVIGMTELEEAMLGANGPALTESLLARLAKADDAIAASMQRGLAPGAYEIGKRARTALAAAQEIALLFQKRI